MFQGPESVVVTSQWILWLLVPRITPYPTITTPHATGF